MIDPGNRQNFVCLVSDALPNFSMWALTTKTSASQRRLRITSRHGFLSMPKFTRAYQTEPNFQSNIGPTNVRAPHFDTNDIFSLTYRWLPRLSTVTSYTFQRIKYESSSVSSSPSLAAIGAAQDRFQNTLAESVQFSLTSRTSLTGSYRFEVIDYDTATSRDATIHYALAGVDHHLTEYLSINVTCGSIISFFQK